MDRIISAAGLLVFIAIAVMFSEKRTNINWRLVLWGIGLQVVFALCILKTKIGALIFRAAQVAMTGIVQFTEAGSEILFGTLVTDQSLGAMLAFRMLPIVIFVGSLMALLWYFRIIQAMVRCMAWIMQCTMKATGVEAFGSGLFVFMGIEAITALKAYIGKMSRAELFTIMVAFMSTIAGSVMAIYVGFGAEAGHLLAASVMSAPAAIAIANIMVPGQKGAETGKNDPVTVAVAYDNPLEAAADGAMDGMKLALNIGAMLLAFISLVALFNFPLSYVNTSFEQILGWVCTPFAVLMGVPFSEAASVGELIGVKTVLNEFIAFMKMNSLIEANALSPRSIVIATYSLCGFANFGSLAILIGAVSSLAPSRKKDVVNLGFRSLVAGTLVKFMTATIAGILIS